MAHGQMVDAAARRSLHLVPEGSCAKREKRDGAHFHITLIGKDELSELAVSPQELQLEAAKLAKEASFVSLGLGTAKQGEATCHFVVVLWAAAQQLRHSHSLASKNFHITLGFNFADLHSAGVRKGPRQLEPPPSSATPDGHDWWAEACAELRSAVQHARQAGAAAEERRAEEDALAIATLLIERAQRVLGESRPPPEAHAELLCSRCTLLGRAGRPWEALEDAEAAARLAPERPRPWLLCAASYASVGEWGAALRSMERARGPMGERVGGAGEGCWLPLSAGELAHAEQLSALCQRRSSA